MVKRILIVLLICICGFSAHAKPKEYWTIGINRLDYINPDPLMQNDIDRVLGKLVEKTGNTLQEIKDSVVKWTNDTGDVYFVTNLRMTGNMFISKDKVVAFKNSLNYPAKWYFLRGDTDLKLRELGFYPVVEQVEQ